MVMMTVMEETMLNKKRSGFTLIELLVVIGILAVLLTITLIAINPRRQLQLANDTQRRSDVQAILNAIYQYSTDHTGQFPAGMPASGASEPISSAAGGTGAAFCQALVTATPNYIAAIPRDPTTGSYTDCNTYSSGYTIQMNANGRITVAATPEVAPVPPGISVTR